MVAIQDWLQPVVEDACSVLRLQDGDEIATTDPVVVLCAQIAYSEVVSYCKRPFHSNSYTEYYPKVENGKTNLRVYPVDEVASIYYGTQLDEEITDYTVHYNELWLTDWLSDYWGETCAKDVDIEVTYTAGSDLASDEDLLEKALVAATIYFYYQKDRLGIFQMTLGGTGSSNVFLGSYSDLPIDIKLLLSPFVYYGNAKERKT